MTRAVKYRGLVADIGGTNARFALVMQRRESAGRGYRFCQQQHYHLDDFPDFPAMVRHYLNNSDCEPSPDAVLAVAGPVRDNRCVMTNGTFVIDGAQLQNAGLFGQCQVINDFAALALSLPFLSAGELLPIGPAGEPAGDSRLVVGPGTGLGAAFLAENPQGHFVLEGEGGHMAFAPVDETEEKLLRWFSDKYGRVSWERLLSGPGLVDLYEALAEEKGRPGQRPDVREIMRKGLSSKGTARRTLQQFCALLGSFAGDLALAGGSWRGVYIAGGIMPRMQNMLASSRFRARFEAKGRFAERMKRMPTWLITAKTPAFSGAASLLPAV